MWRRCTKTGGLAPQTRKYRFDQNGPVIQMPHPHTWRERVRNAFAFYSKRSDGQINDLIWTKGDIDGCMFCEELRIRPHKKDLSPVRVTVVEWDDVPFFMEAA